MKLVPIEGETNLYKDKTSQGVIDLDIDKIKAAKESKKKRIQRLKQQERLSEEVDQLKQDVSDIKNLLQTIAEKL